MQTDFPMQADFVEVANPAAASAAALDRLRRSCVPVAPLIARRAERRGGRRW